MQVFQYLVVVEDTRRHFVQHVAAAASMSRQFSWTPEVEQPCSSRQPLRARAIIAMTMSDNRAAILYDSRKYAV
jgi:hypothetical protein